MPIPDDESVKLYHGTPTELGQDDIIKPQKRSGRAHQPDEDAAFATDDLDTAKQWAGMKAHLNGLLFAPVYEVSHIDPEEEKEYRNQSEFGKDVVSRKGFRVNRLHGWEINPYI